MFRYALVCTGCTVFVDKRQKCIYLSSYVFSKLLVYRGKKNYAARSKTKNETRETLTPAVMYGTDTKTRLYTTAGLSTRFSVMPLRRRQQRISRIPSYFIRYKQNAWVTTGETERDMIGFDRLLHFVNPRVYVFMRRLLDHIRR